MTRTPNIRFRGVKEINEINVCGEKIIMKLNLSTTGDSAVKDASTLTNLRSITSCNINRIRDDVFLSLTIFSI